MRLREIEALTIGSRVRDTTSCVFAPQSVGAKWVPLGHGLVRSCNSLKATTKTIPTLKIVTSPWLGLQISKTRALR